MTSRNQVTIVHTEMCVGGVEKVLLTFLDALVESGYEVKLVLRNPAVWDARIPTEVDTKYLFSENPRTSSPYLYRAWKYLSAFAPRIILKKIYPIDGNSLTIAFHDPMIFALRAASGRKIAWIHGDYATIPFPPEVNELRRKKGFVARMFRARRASVHGDCETIVCVSEMARQGYNTKFPEAAPKTKTVYNLQDTKRIRALAELADEWLHRDSSETVLFCTVGRFSSEKRYDRVISAAEKLKAEGYRFQITMVGDGPTIEAIQSQARSAGLSGEITFVGASENPYSTMSSSDYLICCSEYEALSTVACEAMILGTPVVTTNCAGMLEILGEEPAGLITTNDDAAIYHALKQVLDNPGLRESHSERARIRGSLLSSQMSFREINEIIEGCKYE